jgi:hypothetical protein
MRVQVNLAKTEEEIRWAKDIRRQLAESSETMRKGIETEEKVSSILTAHGITNHLNYNSLP